MTAQAVALYMIALALATNTWMLVFIATRLHRIGVHQQDLNEMILMGVTIPPGGGEREDR